MSLLEGPIQSWINQGLGAGGVLLDVTVTKRSTSYTPGTGATVLESATRISRAGFPDDDTGRFSRGTSLGADESMLVLAQKPVRDAGVEIDNGDYVTIHRASGDRKVEVVEVTQDPAEATYVCRAKGVG